MASFDYLGPSFSSRERVRLLPVTCKTTIALGMILTLIVIALFPQRADASYIREYTKGRFTFSGSLGLRYKENHRNIKTSPTQTYSLRETVETNVNGFVWDPRFMTFKAGLTFRHEKHQTDGAGSATPTSYQYSLFTTWLPKRRHPFIMHAHHIITEVKSDHSPTYESVTDSIGMRWSMHRRLLGNVSFNYDARMSKSYGSTSKRDQVDQKFKLAGQRKFKKRRSKTGSDINYGYLYDLKKNNVSGREASEHRINIADRTVISPTAELSADASYYIKEGSGDSVFSVQSLRAGSRLSKRVSEQLGTNYGLSAGASKSDASNSQSVGGSAGLSYLISERWQSNAGISLAGNSTTAAGGDDRVNSSANGGVSYRQQLGIYNFSSNYGLSVSSVMAGDERGNNSIGHSFGLGLSQGSSILWSDSISYTLSYNESKSNTATSHGITYNAKSQFSLRDRVYLSSAYNIYSEEDSAGGPTVDREGSTRRAELGWTHKFSFSSSLNASTSYSASDRSSTDSELSDNQTKTGRVTFRTNDFLGLRSVMFASKLGYRQSEGSQSVDSYKITADANFNYRIGRWITSLKLEYTEGESGAANFANRSLTFNIKRMFGFRF
jgi:hypothetical protein